MIENPMYLADPPEPEPDRSAWVEKYGDIVDALPDEAIDALASGGEWVQNRNSIDGADAWASYDDDDEDTEYGPWRQYWYVPELQVSEGRLFEVIHDVDTDGNWEINTEAEVGTPEHKAMLDEFSLERHAAAWREYAAWVVEHGKDPLNNYFVRASIKSAQRWQFVYAQSIVGPRLRGARRNSRGQWQSARDLPKSVREYLLVNEQGFLDAAELVHLEPGEDAWAWLVEVCANSDMKKQRAGAGEIKGVATIEVSTPNRSYTRQLRQAAQKHLRVDNKGTRSKANESEEEG